MRDTAGAKIAAALLVAGTAMWCGTAAAGNQDSFALGNEAALTGGAVTAVAGDSGAAWYNPAGLATLRSNTVDVSASAFVIRERSVPNALETSLPFAELSQDLSSLDILSVPSALVWVRELDQGLSAAFGVFVPVQDRFSITVTESIQTEGRTGDEDGRFEQNYDLDFSRSRYHAGPSLGWAATDSVRLGMSVFGVYEARDRESSYWSAGASSTGRRAFTLNEQSSDSQVVGGQVVGGLQWEFARGFHLGLTLRSPVWTFAAWGGRDVLGTRSRVAPNGDADVEVLLRDEDIDDPSFTQLSPARGHLGVAAEIGGGWVSIEGDYALENRESGVAPASDAVWNARIGGLVPLSDNVNLGLGLFTDRTAVRAVEEAGHAKVDFYGVATGLELLSPYQVSGADDPLIFATTIGARYGLGLGQVGGLRFEPLLQRPATDLLVDVVFHEVSVHCGSALYF
jgi:hypothetical protein